MKFRLVEDLLLERKYYLYKHDDGNVYGAFVTNPTAVVTLLKNNKDIVADIDKIYTLPAHKFDSIRNSVIMLNKDENRQHRDDSNMLCQDALKTSGLTYDKILVHHRTRNETNADLTELVAIPYDGYDKTLADGIHLFLEAAYANDSPFGELSPKNFNFYSFECGVPITHTISVR